MSIEIPTTESSQPPEPGDVEDLPTRSSLLHRVADGYLYGNQFVVTALSFVSALVVGAVLIAVADERTRTSAGYFFQHPADTLNDAWDAISAGYAALFRGAIFNFDSLYSDGGVAILGPISSTLVNAAPLILGGLAVTLAFRAGLFNIGVQGQLIMGAIFAGYVGFAWHLPPFVHVVFALIAGMLGGALWGGLVGLLKARTGAHEVITTIMFNYIAYYLLGYLLTLNGFQAPGSSEATTSPIDSSARLPVLFENVHAGLLIALVAASGCWWLLSRSTLGFRIRAIGANPYAARTSGMSVERGYLTVMILAGALAGLVGCSQVLGTRQVLTQDVDAAFGFDAITVALLGRGSPVGTVLAGLLFGAFRAGSIVMGSQTSTPPDIVSVIEPMMVLFIAAPALIRGIFGLRAARGRLGTGALAKGWNG